MLLVLCLAAEREFTVLAYNVENLFDLDGIAIYKDYIQDEPDDQFTYGRLKLLTKLQNIAAVLKTFNTGAWSRADLISRARSGLHSAELGREFGDLSRPTQCDQCCANANN